jgi:hypothetical protein
MAVLLLLCYAGILPWDKFWPLLGAGFLFKVLIALLDTPLLYAGVYIFKKLFQLEQAQEIQID